MVRATRYLSAGFLAATLASGPALAETYSLANFLGPTHATTRGQQTFADNVKRATGGRITFEVFPGGSLVPARATLEAIRDGIATGGYVAGTYTPSDLPLTNTIADLGWLKPDPLLMAIASTDHNLNDPDLQSEWRKHNVVYLAGYASNPYRLICRGEVKGLADVRGKKIRMPGGAWDRVAVALGATPVNVPSSEMYTGLERGSIDCAVNGADALAAFSLWDVAKSINLVSFGTYFSGFNIGINGDFWKGLDDKDRALLMKEAARAVVMTQAYYEQGDKETLAAAAGKPTKVIEPDQELVRAVADFAASDVETVKKNAVERLKVKDPGRHIDGFNQVVAKWEALLKDVDRTDTEALIRLVETEIYAKVSPKDYAMR
jgi:TRAP-type C4-dicarboxylate transport system substrate-binding protein